MSAVRSRPDVPFAAHIELLRFFLVQRDEIVERIGAVLNAQRAPVEYLQDGWRLARDFEDCFFGLAGVGTNEARLRGQLEEAHWAAGFRPRPIAGLHNGPADPAEMMMRAFYLWRQTRWPGRNGRRRYAHTLFNLYVLRCLELLCMRLWDEGSSGAGGRLSQLQGVLDQLWAIRTGDQPVFVRDARWFIQLAQSLATDDLGAYFDVAAQVARLPHEDRLVIHAAGVRMAAGHLRSQIRYRAIRDAASPNDERLISSTRTSNALDFALLVQELVPLLDAYEHACRAGIATTRLDLADAICQGISPDPDLFVNHVDLLRSYSMIEHLFITSDDGGAAYTPMGQRHAELLEQYEPLIGRLAAPLADDCPQFRPAAGAYSPYGALYGFSSDLIKHMALKATQPDPVTNFSLEDVFVSDAREDKLAWVSGWRRLPHLKPEVQKQFDYPHEFATQMFDRVEQALRRRAADATASTVRTGRLFVVSGDDDTPGPVPSIGDLPSRYIGSSDPQVVSAHKAHACEEAQLLSDRREGKFVLSYQTPAGWVAISKAILTEVLGAGRDAKIAGLPPAAARALRLMCSSLVAPGL